MTKAQLAYISPEFAVNYPCGVAVADFSIHFPFIIIGLLSYSQRCQSVFVWIVDSLIYQVKVPLSFAIDRSKVLVWVRFLVLPNHFK